MLTNNINGIEDKKSFGTIDSNDSNQLDGGQVETANGELLKAYLDSTAKKLQNASPEKLAAIFAQISLEIDKDINTHEANDEKVDQMEQMEEQ